MKGKLLNRRGMTLVEMLVALAVFMTVMAGTLKYVVGESRGFRRASSELGMATALRFGTEALALELRLAGSNVGDGQPEVVYAGSDVFSFNADYASNIANDLAAAYIDVDAPNDAVQSIRVARALPVPGSSPAFVYPLADYLTAGLPSAAETITYFFAPDASSQEPGDFMLFRQVNDLPAEEVVRHVLPHPDLPFFSYLRLRAPTGAARTLDSVPASWLPLRHDAAQHNSVADTGTARRVDSLRAVRVAFAIHNGQPGAEARTREISSLIPLPNLGLTKLKSCGDEPMFGQILLAVPGVGPAGPVVDLSWGQAIDESGGERDVMRYVVWRRPEASSDWGTPLLSLPSGNGAYIYTDPSVASGERWTYAVAAQDCTPSLSNPSVSATVLIP